MISLENPLQIMPEHAPGCRKGTAKMVHDACAKWLRERGERPMGMREMVHEGVKEGERRKTSRRKTQEKNSLGVDSGREGWTAMIRGK